MRFPPKKPADKFGTLIFGRDGSVRPDIHTLSSVKSEKEQSVGERFVAALSKGGVDSSFSRMLEEADHDFEILLHGSPVLVQAVELNKREYMRMITDEEYMSGAHGSTTKIDGQYWSIDELAMEDSLSRLISLKLSKGYATRGSPTWLLVWTTAVAFTGSYVQEGVLHSSPALAAARELLGRNGSGPFSEVWLFNLITRPERVWPNAEW